MHFENCADIDGFLKLGHILLKHKITYENNPQVLIKLKQVPKQLNLCIYHVIYVLAHGEFEYLCFVSVAQMVCINVTGSLKRGLIAFPIACTWQSITCIVPA